MIQANIDEALLTSKIVDPALAIPTMHQALRIALYDEYHARAVYTKVVQTFGFVPPFSNIVSAEENHINALLGLFAKYGVEPVIDDWAAKVRVKPTFIQNCEVGIAAEIDNIRMYDNLIPYAEMPDVLDIFYRLQAASFNNHLPAFRACVANSYNTASQQSSSTQNIPNDPGIQGQNMLDSLKGMFGQNPNIQAMSSMFQGMGTEFIVGAAAGAVIMGLLNNGGLSTLFNQQQGE